MALATSPMTFRTTDLPASQAKAETFADGRLRILSRSGLHITEGLLINRICARGGGGEMPPPVDLLISGNRTGALAMVAAACFPSTRVTLHVLDIHHARTIHRNLLANGLPPPAFTHDPFVQCPVGMPEPEPPSPSLLACTSSPPQGPYDLALYAAASTVTTGELFLDQLEEIHARLTTGGGCVIAYEGDTGPVLKQIHKVFGNLSAHTDKRGVFCVTAIKRAPLGQPRVFRAAFTASLPGGGPVTLSSLPGVFCHRRPDMGGLALAEIAAQEKVGPRILDLGCGCGLAGILLATRWPDAQVTFVDSHARALAVTHHNLTALGIAAPPPVLSDTGLPDTGFDMAVGNPPYFTDFRIAQLFVDVAWGGLRKGGVGFLVAKSPTGLLACVKTRFADTAVIPRRGYSVIRFVRT